MKLEDLQVYNESLVIAEKIWSLVDSWDKFSKNTIGNQIVRSADSVSANISEGYGRYHFKENKHFCYYARGSLFETKTWLTKAKCRNLINAEDFNKFITEINNISIKLNKYIRAIGK